VSAALELDSSSTPANCVRDVRFLRFCNWPDPDLPLSVRPLFDGRSFTFERRGIAFASGQVRFRVYPDVL